MQSDAIRQEQTSTDGTPETSPPCSESASSLGPARDASALAAITLLLAACGGSSGDEAEAKLSTGSARFQPELMPRSTGGREVARAARIPTASEVFEWAQRQFPALFSTNETNVSASGGLVFRFYPGTGHYLAVLDGNVLVLGPITQGQVTNVGPLASFADAVNGGTDGGKPSTDAEAARFLLHAQFSASEAEIAAVKAKGYAVWLDDQLALPNSQSGWDWLVSKGYSVIDMNEFFSANSMQQYMVWYQLMQSPDAVRRRWAWALSEVFVVSWRGIKDVMNWDGFGMAEYWDILCRLGLGNYRALLEALSVNPAMGAFLSTRGNLKEDPETGRLPDENYAREVMQLFSIGLYELNLDGTVKRNANGQPLETYTSDDVSNLARVFTGYNHDYSRPTFMSPKPPNLRWQHIESARGRMVFSPQSHSLLEKRFLGVTIPANTQGPDSLRIALDTLANHPTTAPFLCRQFIQRMVTSDPSPAYVQRVAQVFNNNGSGVRGDLKAVLNAILLDNEALNPANVNSTTFGKLRSPVLRIAQWARTFKVRSVYGSWKMPLWDGNPVQDANQYPLNPPSVFSYYRPGYVPPGTAMASAGSTAPEFQIVNESSVAAWINLLQSFAKNGFWVNAPNQPGFGNNATDGHDIVPDYTTEIALVTNSQALVDRLNLLLCAGQLSPATVQLIVTALKADRIQANSSDDFKQVHVARALMFVMCSAEYLAQR
jgi:uncharacterized protein (DUF1800 family)